MKLIRTEKLASTVPYAYAAESNGLVFTAGACPLDKNGVVVAPGDVEAQTHQTMRNLVVALEAAGVGLADLVKTTVFVASNDRADLVAAWQVYLSYLGTHEVPSTLLGVTVLGYENQLVEVDAVASGFTKE